MTAAEWVLYLSAGLGCVGLSLLLLRAAWDGSRIVRFDQVRPAEPAQWPSLTLVVPACNEAATLEPALTTLRALDYPDLEILVVDDRSTDGTGEIVDRVAGQDPRVVPVHVRDLPSGWLGKPHAMHTAARRARGEWILFTDADIHFEPGALKRAVALCLERGWDHLTIGPQIPRGSFGQQVAIAVFAALFTGNMRIGRDGTVRPPSYAGIGAFNLVRRDAYERSEGFEWLRMELADDMGFGLVMRRAGARTGVAFSRGDVRVDWYPTLRQLYRGFEKNLFGAACAFRYWRAGVAIALCLWFAAAPFLTIPFPDLWPLGAGAYGVTLVTAVPMLARMRRRLYAAFLMPMGLVFFAGLFVRSALHCAKHRGIVWRGTRYPVQELRLGRRVTF